jgi:hypothetical protein
VTAGADRADRIREFLAEHVNKSASTSWLPPGSVVLTADEYADLMTAKNTLAMANTHLAIERSALIRAGDVLATRLDETTAVSYDAHRRDPDWFRQRQQAVREWLAVAHPDGEGHVDATTVGERGECPTTWDEATE